MPSRAVNVFGAQFTFTHPAKSRPLNSGVHGGSAERTESEAAKSNETTSEVKAGDFTTPF